MLKKTRGGSNSQTLRKFEQFMRKRLQKKNILQSNESINKKIECFEELLKLTKSGETLVTHTPKDSFEPVTEIQKNTVEKGKSECEQYQNTQLVLGKLDKMVHDLNGWVNSKKTSTYEPIQRKPKATKKSDPVYTPNDERKFTKFDYNSAKVSRAKHASNIQQFTTEEVPIIQQKPGYAPHRKKHHLTRHNSSRIYIKNKNTTSKTIDITTKTPDFSALKNQITEYQLKAKQIYGLTFQISKQKESQAEETEIDDIFTMKQESKEMMRVISLNQFKKSNENPYQQMLKQHTRQDSSVPSNLLGIIRSSSARTRKKMGFNPSISRFFRV